MNKSRTNSDIISNFNHKFKTVKAKTDINHYEELKMFFYAHKKLVWSEASKKKKRYLCKRYKYYKLLEEKK